MAVYQDHGFHNDRPSAVWNYLRPPLMTLLNKDVNRCILDMGCGNGYFVTYLISQGFNVYGIDASEGGIAIASKNNPGHFFVQDISSNELPGPIRNLQFDTVISTEVIEHLYNPSAFIDLCKKALGDNPGQLIISTPYHGYLKNLILSVFNKWDFHHNPLRTGGHIKFWSKNTLSALLINSGFTVTAFKGCGRLPYFWKSMIIQGTISS